MKQIIETILRPLIRAAYPRFNRQKGYTTYRRLFLDYYITQKIIGINRQIPWPVHFTSTVRGWQHIEKGICCDPGDNRGTYINAFGGLKFGDNVNIGPNVIISTVNHDKYDDRKQGVKRGITIGSNVWIGGNCTITAGVTIGDNVTIGAGCVIRNDVPSNVTVVQSSQSLEYHPKHEYLWDCRRDPPM